MKKYNYLEAMKSDIRDYVENEIDFSEFDNLEELEEKLNDTLWTEDSVTGNASGSYTFSRATAEEYVNSNKEIVNEMIAEFDNKEQVAEWWLNDDFEKIDVSIRCYLLGAVIADVIEGLKENF